MFRHHRGPLGGTYESGPNYGSQASPRGNPPRIRPGRIPRQGAGTAFLTRSTAASNETVEWEDGGTYPVVDVQISSASHPFWTGRSRVLDDEGRVAKFYKKYGKQPK
ncbi:hypothetical protein GCM10029992_62930 [Glycomyces albus]